ncbi:MAG: siroheme synthase CysG [Pseudomonadales bacterium]
MDYLPLFVDLRGRSCLLVGGGEVAGRKLELLLRAGANVEIVAPVLGARTRELAHAHGLTHQARVFQAGDVTGRVLVVAATDQASVNESVFIAASAANVLVNSVDQPAISNVIFPAIVDRSPVLVAISTGGGSPTLARTVRGWLEARLPARLGALAGFIRERRDQVKSSLETIAERQRFWERVINGPTAEQVLQGNLAAAERAFAVELAGSDRGFVALIGAGPGDPELLTLKALRLLQSADVVLYDNLVNRQILEFARRDAEQIYVGKKWRAASTRQEAINALLVEQALAGRNVARLKGGDPFIFGRGGEEMAALLAVGVDCVVVPGITAALGASSYAGIPLTHRDAAQSVRFVTGHRAHDRINLDWPELARPDQTLVIYMGLPGIEEITRQLVAHGLPPDTPAALIEKATLPEQRVVIATAADLAERVRAVGVGGPTLAIVGNVVAFRQVSDARSGVSGGDNG